MGDLVIRMSDLFGFPSSCVGFVVIPKAVWEFMTKKSNKKIKILQSNRRSTGVSVHNSSTALDM